MPAHVVLGFATLLVATVAALVALVHALVPASRRALRWPTLALAVVALVGALATSEAGATLLDAVQATGSAEEVAAAQTHAKGSDTLATALFLLVVAVLSTTWGALRPGRTAWTVGARIGASAVALTAVGTLAGVVLVVGQALAAVAAGHPTWS